MKLKAAVAVLILVMLGLTVFGERGMVRLMRLKARHHELALERNRIQAENRELSENIEKLHNDSLYIERLARERYGMVKPDEFVFLFPDPAPEK